MYGAKGTSTLINTVARQGTLAKQLAAAHASPKTTAFIPNLPARNLSAGKLSYTTSRASSHLNVQPHDPNDNTQQQGSRRRVSYTRRSTEWRQLSKLSRISQARFHSSLALAHDVGAAPPTVLSEETLGEINARIMDAARAKDPEAVMTEFLAVQNAKAPLPTETYEAVLKAYGSLRKNNQPLAPMLKVYDDMVAMGIKPSSSIYALLIQSLCTRDMEVKRTIHMLRRRIARSGTPVESLSELESERNMEQAIALFDKAVKEHQTDTFDIHVYNSLLRALSGEGNEGKTKDGIYVFEQLEMAKNVRPNSTTFAMLMNMFGSAGNLTAVQECFNEYRAAQSHMPNHNSSYVYNALVNAHVSAGDIAGAINIVEKVMVEDNVAVSILPYNRIIAGASQQKNMDLVMELLQKLENNPTLPKPDVNTYGLLLSAYCHQKDLVKAEDAYSKILKFDISKQYGHLADYVSFCRAMKNPEKALEIVKTMDERGMTVDTTICNEVVLAFADNSDLEKASEAVISLLHLNAKSSVIDYQSPLVLTAMNIARDCKSLPAALSIIATLTEFSVHVNGPVASAVLDKYVASKQDADQWGRFVKSLDDRTFRVLYDTLFRRSSKPEKFIDTAFMLLEDMRLLNVQPSASIYVRVASRLAKYKEFEVEAKWKKAFEPYLPAIEEQIKQDHIRQEKNQNGAGQTHVTVEADLQTGKAVSVALQGNLEEAKRILEETVVNQGGVPTVEGVRDIIRHASQVNRIDMAQAIYDLVLESINRLETTRRFRANHVLYNSMLIAYARQNDLENAKIYYNKLRENDQYPDADAYGTLLACTANATSGECSEALQIYEEAKQHNVRPTIYFYNVVISKLAKSRMIDEALAVFGDMERLGFYPNSITYGALISACLRKGMEGRATQYFKDMLASSKSQPRIGPFNNMIQYHVQKRENREKALEYYNMSKQYKVKPSSHTYRLLIEAYANIPPYDMPAAHRLLTEMEKRDNLKPEPIHYATLIRSYGCVHRDLASAKAIYNEMVKAGVTPDESVYQAMKDAEQTQ